MDKVMKANKLYNAMPSHDRNDAMAMQYLIPNWKYDCNKPASSADSKKEALFSHRKGLFYTHDFFLNNDKGEPRKEDPPLSYMEFYRR